MCKGFVMNSVLIKSNDDLSVRPFAGAEVEVDTKEWEHIPNVGRLFTVRPINQPEHKGVKISDRFLKVEPDGTGEKFTLSRISDRLIRKFFNQ